MPRKTRKEMLNPRPRQSKKKKKALKKDNFKPRSWYDEDKFIVNLRKSMKVGEYESREKK